MKKIVVLLILAALEGAGRYWHWQNAANPLPTFRKVPLERGDLLVTINATGTIEP